MYPKKIQKPKAPAKKTDEHQEKKVRYKSLIINGARYRTMLTRKFKNRKNWAESDEKKIISFIPGTIIKVFSKAEQKVHEGDKMMILEAMKMQNTIYHPHNAKIKAIYVNEGDKIPKNFLILEYY